MIWKKKNMDDKHKIAMTGRFVLVSVIRKEHICILFSLAWSVEELVQGCCVKKWFKRSAYLSDTAMNHSCNL